MRTLLLFIFLTCAYDNTYAQTLRVAIASSLTPMMNSIKKSYEDLHNIKIELIPGASGTITHQMSNGAPFDIFISADSRYTEILFENNTCNMATPWVTGKIVLWTRQPLTYTKNTVNAIAIHLDKVELVAIAQPEIAPYGAAALLYINEHKFEINNKMVFGNSIAITNQYIYAQSADAVFTSASSQRILEGQSQGYWTALDGDSNLLIHSIASSKSANQILATEFITYLYSKSVLALISSYGYNPPPVIEVKK